MTDGRWVGMLVGRLVGRKVDSTEALTGTLEGDNPASAF